MNKGLTILAITVLVALVGLGMGFAQSAAPVYGQGQGWNCPRWAQGQGTQQQSGWNCPRWGRGGGPQAGWNCPRGGRGPGMMGGGPGWQRGRGPGPCCGGGFNQGKPVSKDQAQSLMENYIKNTNNPNLKLGEITEKDNTFEVDILTKEGSLVDKIQVDKATGFFRSVY